MTEYPLGRPGYFCCKYQDWLYSSHATEPLGQSEIVILGAVVGMEDRLRYKCAPEFTDEQLAARCRMSLRTLQRKRAELIEAKLLAYLPGVKGKPSRYWVKERTSKASKPYPGEVPAEVKEPEQVAAILRQPDVESEPDGDFVRQPDVAFTLPTSFVPNFLRQPDVETALFVRQADVESESILILINPINTPSLTGPELPPAEPVVSEPEPPASPPPADPTSTTAMIPFAPVARESTIDPPTAEILDPAPIGPPKRNPKAGKRTEEEHERFREFFETIGRMTGLGNSKRAGGRVAKLAWEIVLDDRFPLKLTAEELEVRLPKLLRAGNRGYQVRGGLVAIEAVEACWEWVLMPPVPAAGGGTTLDSNTLKGKNDDQARRTVQTAAEARRKAGGKRPY